MESRFLSKHIFTLSDNLYFDCWIVTLQNNNGEKEYWFKADDITTILQFTKPVRVIRRYVRQEWKKSWSEFQSYFNINWKQNLIFINEYALYSLINRSTQSLEFHNWIRGEIKPNEKQFSDLMSKQDQILQLVLNMYHQNNKPVTHIFHLLKRRLETENEYQFVRCLKKNLTTTLKSKKGFESIFYKENVLNAISILPKCKQILVLEKIPFTSYHNRIKTADPNFEDKIKEIINNNF